MHYLLFYEKIADYAQRQVPLHPAHWQHLQAAVLRGELLLGGSLEDPTDGSALLLFRADSPSVVEAFAAADPFVTGGIVNRWRVRAWTTVVGTGTAMPTDGEQSAESR